MAAGSISMHHPNEDILDLLYPVARRAVQTRLEWLTGGSRSKKQAKLAKTPEMQSSIGEPEKPAPETAVLHQKNSGSIEQLILPSHAETEKTHSSVSAEKTASPAKTQPPISHTQTESNFSNSIQDSRLPTPIFENAKLPMPMQRTRAAFGGSVPPTGSDSGDNFKPYSDAFSQPVQYIPISKGAEQIELLSHASLKSQNPKFATAYLENLKTFVLELAQGSKPARAKLSLLLSDAVDSIKSGKGISEDLHQCIISQFKSLIEEVRQSLWKAEISLATSRFEPLSEGAAKNPLTPDLRHARTIAASIGKSGRPAAFAQNDSFDSQDLDSLEEMTSSPLMYQRAAGANASRCIVSKGSTSIANHHSFSRMSHRHCPIDGFIASGGIALHVMHFRSSLKVFYNGLNWIGGWYLIERQCKLSRFC
jgi:hypothetical protein